MDTVKTTQTALLTEVQEQSAKFGDDVKYLVSNNQNLQAGVYCGPCNPSKLEAEF